MTRSDTRGIWESVVNGVRGVHKICRARSRHYGIYRITTLHPSDTRHRHEHEYFRVIALTSAIFFFPPANIRCANTGRRARLVISLILSGMFSYLMGWKSLLVLGKQTDFIFSFYARRQMIYWWKAMGSRICLCGKRLSTHSKHWVRGRQITECLNIISREFLKIKFQLPQCGLQLFFHRCFLFE